MRFVVSVGDFAFCSTILPSGTSPNLIRAWNPLQIPSASPSRLFNRSMTASFNFSFLNAVAKNFADPSGSSPALNPPGNMIFTVCSWEYWNKYIWFCNFILAYVNISFCIVSCCSNDALISFRSCWKYFL